MWQADVSYMTNESNRGIKFAFGRNCVFKPSVATKFYCMKLNECIR
jgi:hypothetical protein